MIINKLFEGCDVETGVDYLEHKEHYDALGGTVVYTGTIDATISISLASWSTAACALSPRY